MFSCFCSQEVVAVWDAEKQKVVTPGHWEVVRVDSFSAFSSQTNRSRLCRFSQMSSDAFQLSQFAANVLATQQCAEAKKMLDEVGASLAACVETDDCFVQIQNQILPSVERHQKSFERRMRRQQSLGIDLHNIIDDMRKPI